MFWCSLRGCHGDVCAHALFVHSLHGVPSTIHRSECPAAEYDEHWDHHGASGKRGGDRALRISRGTLPECRDLSRVRRLPAADSPDFRFSYTECRSSRKARTG